MNRAEFERMAEETYGERADHPFEKYPSVAVFRHSGNRKWFAAVMTVPRTRLGIKGEGDLDIVNVKCAPEIIDSFRHEAGIYPAYHMSKAHWLTVALDGSADDESVRFLLGVSYELTRAKIRGRRGTKNEGEAL